MRPCHSFVEKEGDKTQLGTVNASLQNLEGYIYIYILRGLYVTVYVYYVHTYIYIYIENYHITSHITGFLKSINYIGSGPLTCVSSNTSWSNFGIAKPDASVMGPFCSGLAPRVCWIMVVPSCLDSAYRFSETKNDQSRIPNPGLIMIDQWIYPVKFMNSRRFTTIHKFHQFNW